MNIVTVTNMYHFNNTCVISMTLSKVTFKSLVIWVMGKIKFVTQFASDVIRSVCCH